MGLFIEIAHFLFVWNYSLKAKWFEVLTVRIIHLCAVLFLFGKYVSHSVEEEFRQFVLSVWMLTIILVMMLVTALVTILSVAVWAVKLYRGKNPKVVIQSEPTSLLKLPETKPDEIVRELQSPPRVGKMIKTSSGKPTTVTDVNSTQKGTNTGPQSKLAENSPSKQSFGSKMRMIRQNTTSLLLTPKNVMKLGKERRVLNI